MKRLGYVAGILLVALSLFASAHGERRRIDVQRATELTPQQEALLIENKLDELSARMDRLKSEMVADRLALLQARQATRPARRTR